MERQQLNILWFLRSNKLVAFFKGVKVLIEQFGIAGIGIVHEDMQLFFESEESMA